MVLKSMHHTIRKFHDELLMFIQLKTTTSSGKSYAKKIGRKKEHRSYKGELPGELLPPKK